MKNLLLLFLLVSLSVGCHNQSGDKAFNKKEYFDSLFNKLKAIEIDSLKNINADRRYENGIIVRYTDNDDSTLSFNILLLKDKDGEIKFMANDSLTKLVTLDSLWSFYLVNDFKLSKERLLYCFKVMDEFDLSKIGYSSYDLTILEIEKDTFSFYYAYDTAFVPPPDLKKHLVKLDANWWFR